MKGEEEKPQQNTEEEKRITMALNIVTDSSLQAPARPTDRGEMVPRIPNHLVLPDFHSRRSDNNNLTNLETSFLFLCLFPSTAFP